MIDEDKLFKKRIDDIITTALEKYIDKSSYFLNPRQQILAEQCAKQRRFCTYVLDGGHKNATRKIFIALSEYTSLDKLILPIEPLSLRFRAEDKITHRDILGALMGLLIKRESIGDILVGNGIAVVFTMKNVANIILSELTKVGNVGVKVSRNIPDVLPEPYRFQEKSGTVNSLRLDCIISFMLNLSRQKSSEFIKSGMVTLNYFSCENISKELKTGDIFSVKGKGKYVVKQVGGETSKGRIHITCCKYI